MADKKNASRQKNNNIGNLLRVRAYHRTSSDIKRWRQAIQIAENWEEPNRYLLYELYNDILLDGRLLSLIEKRKMNITNSPVTFVEQGSEGEENETVQEAIESVWFYETLNMIMEAKFWGFNLIEFSFMDGRIVEANEIHKANVRPEFGDVLLETGNTGNTIDFTERPYCDYTIAVGKERSLGLLMTAAQYVIYKRGAFGDWAQFAEIFGMPFRVGKYGAYDDSTRRKLEKALEEMGSAPWAVIPQESEIDVISNTNQGTSSQVYDMLRQACNEELSILILGQTMTTTDGSSRSQSETHKKVEEEINLSDKIWVQFVLNEKLKPLMQKHGYPVGKGKFVFPEVEKLSKEKRFEMLLKINREIAPIDPHYFAEEFDVPLMDKPEPSEAPPIEKKKLKLTLNENYFRLMAQANNCCDHTYTIAQLSIPKPLEERLLKAAFDGTLGEFDHDFFNELASELIRGIQTGWTTQDFDYNAPDHLAQMMMEANIFMFTAAKDVATLLELNRIANTSENFSDFKIKATELLDLHTIHYAQTEYNLTVSAAQNAANYLRQLEEMDVFPYWEYQTIGDERVRKGHKALDGLVLRADDDVWKNIYPPNGWNCRCEVIQRDELDGKELSTGEQAIALLGEEWEKMLDDGFAINRGQSYSIFQSNMFYLTSFNENTLGLKENNVRAWRDINKEPFDTFMDNNFVEGVMEDWFNNQVGTNQLNNPNRIRLIDHNNRPIHLDKSVLLTTVQSLRPYLDVVATEPHEVYLSQASDSLYTVKIIRFYKDTALIVYAVLQQNEYKILSIEQRNNAAEIDAIRTGLLIYKQ